MISFTVNALPVAQPRQRHAIRGKGTRQFIANYTPTKHPITAFKQACRIAAKQNFQGSPYEIPLKVMFDFYFPRPKNMIWKTKPMSCVFKTTKPDVDNLFKGIADALTGIIWKDDSYIVVAVIRKYIVNGNSNPGVDITITSE